MKLLSLFSGIGAFEKALDREHIEYELMNYCEIDKYASKAYAAVHGVSEDLNLNDVTKVDTSTLKDIDLITYGFPCVTGDTLIATSEGYKQIVDVREGDMVLTHMGKYNKVERFIPQGKKEIWHIDAMGTHGIDTTENHRFYVRKMYRKGHLSVRTFTDPSWIECKNLNKNYYLGTPVNNNSILFEDNTIDLDFTDDTLWYLAGRYLGDGWLRKDNNKATKLNGVVICCGKHKANAFEMRIGNKYHYTKSETRTTINYIFSSIAIAKLFSLMGHGAANKEIPPCFIDMPVEYLKNIIEGYLDSDGCKTQGLYKITTISPKLVYSAAQVISKVYHRPVSIYINHRPRTCVIEGRTVNQRDSYQLTFKTQTNKQDKAFYENGYVWYPIKSVNNTHKMEDVYDITVETHHSFVANNCIAHNCQDLSQAGNQKGFIDENGNITRSGLFFEALRIIKDLQPKWAICENVKALTSKKFEKEFKLVLDSLSAVGYNNYYQVLNAKDYGIPQNRERIFIISIRKDVDNGGFVFPEKIPLNIRLKDILEDIVDEKFYLSDEQIKRIHTTSYLSGQRRIQDKEWCDTLCARDWKDPKCVRVKQVCNIYNGKHNSQAGRVFDADGLSPTLDTCNGGNRMPKIVERMTKQAYETLQENECNAGDVINPFNKKVVNNGLCPTLTTRPEGFKTANLIVTDNTNDFRIRKLTPKECWRLMGFDDEDVIKAQSVGMSNSQMYKQAGNFYCSECITSYL